MDPKIVRVHGHELRFYLDSERVRSSGGLEGRMARNVTALSLLPLEHITMIIEPIIVVDKFPGGRQSGGGWFPPAGSPGIRASETVEAWLSARGAGNTGVEADEIRERTGGHGGTGIIGITSTAFLKDEQWGSHKAHEYTLLHEVGHSVDFHSSLIPPPTLSRLYGNGPYQGQRYDGGAVNELAAEAYSRFFLRSRRMCRGGKGTPPCVQPDGSSPAVGEACPSQRTCSARLQRDLKNTAAFAITSVEFPLARLESLEAPDPGTRRPHPSYLARVSNRRGNASPQGGSPYAGWREPGPTNVKV